MSTLYIVPTPIGNLKDITLRSLEILKKVEYIACEDTRRTRILLEHYDIKGKKLLSYYHPKEKEKMKGIIKLLKEGKEVALVSDAGTPLISDPGYILVKECIKEGINVEALPGPTALITALTASGLPTDRFIFMGFPPKKKAKKFWESIKSCKDFTIILYESPERINKTLEVIKDYFNDPDTVIARELTKVNEEFIRGKASILLKKLEETKLKGELVVLFRLC